MSKTYKGDVTGNVVELNLLDANEGTLPNLGTPTVVTRSTGVRDVTQVVGDITSTSGFYFDNDVQGLVIGTSCTSIGSDAFYSCFDLNGPLIIPNSVTSIGQNSFLFCSSLDLLVIPESVTNIEGFAFLSCSQLTAVYTNTPASSFTGTEALQGTTFTTIYTGPNATGYTSSFQGRTGLTISAWTNYPNIP